MPKITVKYPDGDAETFTSIAALADAFGNYREARLAQEKVAASLKERETALSTYLVDNIPKSDATGVIGKVWGAVIKSKTVVQVTDWDAFWSYVFKSKRQDLLQRRVGDAAIKEIWEAGKAVPGVGRIDVPTVSLSKVKA